MARFSDAMKSVIENNTKEDAAKILQLPISSINYYISYYKLSYIKATRKFQSEKSKSILADVIKGELNCNRIAKKHGVSRQYVSLMKKVYEGK